MPHRAIDHPGRTWMMRQPEEITRGQGITFIAEDNRLQDGELVLANGIVADAPWSISTYSDEEPIYIVPVYTRNKMGAPICVHVSSRCIFEIREDQRLIGGHDDV